MKLSRVRIQALRGQAGVFLAIPADGSALDEIKKYIKEHGSVDGARIEVCMNLQIK
nr:MAG TPA: hypothetical protein [Caudoviricetes sp.]